MNIFLFLVYSLIGILTIILMAVLILYLKDKAVHKQTICDQILTDLAIVTGALISSMAFLGVIRELTGPFEVVCIVSSVFIFFQYLYNLMLSCIVSLEVFQVLSIFYAAALSEWNEENLFLTHRTFVVALGCASGSLVCYFNGGMASPTPYYYYILQGNQEPVYVVSMIQSMMLAAFVAIIILCQGAIEVKRFLMNRDENRVDQLAVSALVQIEEATKRLRSQPPTELGVQFLPIRVKIAWTSKDELQGGTTTTVAGSHAGTAASALPPSVTARSG
jgi:hypothetical protein